MKRVLRPVRLWGLALATILGAGWVNFIAAQETPPGAVAALEQEFDEKIKRLAALVQDLLANQAILQKRISALSDELAAQREEQNRTASKNVTHDEFRKALERMAREIEQKRDEDRKLVLDELRKLATAPLPEPPAPKKEKDKPKDPPTDAAPAPPQAGYRYVVKTGDTLGAIVAAYQQSGVKVTLDQVTKANPNLIPKRLLPGQEVFIPDPKHAP